MAYYKRGEILDAYLLDRARASTASAPEPVDPMALSLLQRAALLTMHESPVRRAVVARMLDASGCQDKPSFFDYRALVGLGLAVHHDGKRYHELTTQGNAAVRKLEQKLCATLGIHLLMEFAGAHTGIEARFHCSCGWTTSVRNSHTAPGNAQFQFRQHLRTASRMRGLADALTPMRAEGA